jgi:hypothetical protein
MSVVAATIYDNECEYCGKNVPCRTDRQYCSSSCEHKHQKEIDLQEEIDQIKILSNKIDQYENQLTTMNDKLQSIESMLQMLNNKIK